MTAFTHDTAARTQLGGVAVALGAAFSFGMSGAWARGLIDAGWTPGAAVTVRVWVAALILAVPTLLALRGRWSAVRANAGMILAYGLLAVTATQLCYFQAVAVMDVGIALLVEYTAPVAVVLWMWARHRERPGLRGLVGSVIAFAGLALVLEVFTGLHANPAGIAWALAAMAGAATYFVLSGRSDTGLPPIALSGLGLLVGAVALTVAGATGILPMAWSTHDVAYRFGAVPWFVPALTIGLFATALAYVLGVTSTRMLGARLASFVALAEVVAAMLFGWILLGQLPDAIQAIGGVVLLAGIVVVKLGETAARRTTEPEPALSIPE